MYLFPVNENNLKYFQEKKCKDYVSNKIITKDDVNGWNFFKIIDPELRYINVMRNIPKYFIGYKVLPTATNLSVSFALIELNKYIRSQSGVKKR